MTPIQPDNSDTQQQLQQWLKEVDVDELGAGEQSAIAQLMVELQDLPWLENRLKSLSQWQPAPTNPVRRFLTFLGAGLATAGAVLVWQSSRMDLKMAQKNPALAVAAAKALRTPASDRAKPAPSAQEFLLTSSQGSIARATVTIRPEQATNLLVGNGLPQLPEGQIYRLWAETPFGLRPDPEGNATIKVPREPSGSAISLLISVDPIYEGTSAEQPGKPVLTSI